MRVNLLDIGDVFGLPVQDVFAKTTVRVLPTPFTEADLRLQLLSADLVGFGGGADIHPSLYQSKNVASGVGHHPSERDILEQKVFHYCFEHGIPMFGICRGAQFLCAMSGGKLVQDVQGHGGDHTITTDQGMMLPMTSTHHQMMYPWEVQHIMLAWTGNRSKQYTHDIPNYLQMDKDPEAVYFPTTGALAVQGHPEWMDPDSATVSLVRQWIRQYLHVQV